MESYRKSKSYTCSGIHATYCICIYVDRSLLHDRLEFSWFDIEDFRNILPQLSAAQSQPNTLIKSRTAVFAAAPLTLLPFIRSAISLLFSSTG